MNLQNISQMVIRKKFKDNLPIVREVIMFLSEIKK